MHPTTNTSKAAMLMLAIGLTILTQASAFRPSHSAETAAARHLLEQPLPATALRLPATVAGLDWSMGDPSVPASIQPSICDRCRTICARNCSSYACLACARSTKCGKLVESCYSRLRRR
jgi:hypothetical protein